MTAAEPATALRAHAHGLHHLEAAAEIMINHAGWLHRDDFHRFSHTTTCLIDATR